MEKKGKINNEKNCIDKTRVTGNQTNVNSGKLTSRKSKPKL